MGKQDSALGPAFGCFADGRLVAMAATHFATPEVVEIGHVATHPDYRRRGYATACTAALTRAAFGLASRVFLMVQMDGSSRWQQRTSPRPRLSRLAM